MNLTITDATGIVVSGGRHIFRNTITRDDLAYNITGKTVTATVRREDSPGTIIAMDEYGDGPLETIPVAITAPLTGLVEWTMTAAMSEALLAPPFPARTTNFTVQYHVVEDDFYPDLLRFRARRPGMN